MDKLTKFHITQINLFLVHLQTGSTMNFSGCQRLRGRSSPQEEEDQPGQYDPTNQGEEPRTLNTF